jgi:uncharacterized membrane protein
MVQKKQIIALEIILVIGMLISLFLLSEHFEITHSEFCTFGESFDCGTVNTSPYANLDGIFFLMVFDWGWPVPYVNIADLHWFLDVLTANAFLGFLTLLFVFSLVVAYTKKKDFFWIENKRIITWIRGVLLFGFAYGMYLFYIQHSILLTYCIFCLALDAVLLASVVLAFTLKR